MGGGRLLAAVVAGIVWLAWAGTAVAADWKLQDLPGDGVHTALLGISCPTESMCVAVGEQNVVATSTNPTAGPSAWRVEQPGADVTEEGFSGNPNLFRNVRAVSCPSPSLCVAVTFDGYVYSSTNPTGGASAWRVTDVDGTGRDTHLLGVSCASVNLCVAVSGDRYTAGKVLSTTDPTGGTEAWSVAQLDESLDLRGVSCGTPTSCVAVAQNGRMLVSSNPTGGVSAWREIVPAGPGNLQGVSCVAAVLCVTGNAGGNLLSSTNPLSGAGSWTERNGGGKVPITGISCLASFQCAAVDNNGSVSISADPTGPRSAWEYTNLLPYEVPDEKSQAFNAAFGVSCPSTELCAITTVHRRVYTSTNPFAAKSPRKGEGKTGARKPKRPRAIIAHVDRQHSRTKTGWKTMRFRFFARGQIRGFLCRMDAGPFKPCRSPKRYRVALGKHVFRVRAVGTTGLRGPIAQERFRILPALRADV